MPHRTRRHGSLPLPDRIFARALVLGATSDHPTEAAVNDLWLLAGGDREALKRALGRLDHPSGRVGHPRAIASLLLRSALSYEDSPAGAELRRVAGH
jgi:hypothetical protein